MSLSRRFLVSGALWSLLSLAGPLAADTVYLKNGAWIDGIVRARSDKIVEIEIGRIGKLEVLLEEIHEVEKNNRTGDDYKLPSDGRKLDISHVTRRGERSEPEKKKGEDEKEASDEEEESGDEAEAEEDSSQSPDDDIDPKLRERIEELVKDLERQKPRYRIRAERHLKAIGPPCLPYLLPLVKSDSELARVAAFRLFNEFGDETVVEACIAGLLDTSEYVRSYANKTLKRITHEDFGYSSAASPKRRELAQEKWKKWWEEEKRELAELGKLGEK